MPFPIIILALFLTVLTVKFIRAYNRQKRINELSQEWHKLNRSLQGQLRNIDDIGNVLSLEADTIPDSMDYVGYAMDDVVKSNKTFIRMSEIHAEIVRLKASK